MASLSSPDNEAYEMFECITPYHLWVLVLCEICYVPEAMGFECQRILELASIKIIFGEPSIV